jgi:anti-anti-sigma factor
VSDDNRGTSQGPHNELTIEIEVLSDTASVRCRGALTLTSAGRLRHEVKSLLLHSRVVTVDFTELSRIDSVGLGTMATLYVSARNAGRVLYVVNMGPRVREMFSVTRLLSLFESAGDANVRIH